MKSAEIIKLLNDYLKEGGITRSKKFLIKTLINNLDGTYSPS